MAWNYVGSAGFGSKTAGTSFSSSTAGFNLTAGTMVITVWVCDNPASTTPVVFTPGTEGIGTQTKRSGTVELISATGADVSTTAGSGIWVKAWMWKVNGTVSFNEGLPFSGSVDQSVAARAWGHFYFQGSGDPPTLSVAAATGTSTSGAPSATLGSAAQEGDLIIGLVAAETNATPTGDSDTTNGSWSSVVTQGTEGGGGATTHLKVGMQYKVATASGTQTYNPGTANASVAIVLAVTPGDFDHVGEVALSGEGGLEGYRLGFGEVHLGSEGVLGKRRETRSLLPRRLSSYSVGIGMDGAIGAFSNGKILHLNGNNTSGGYLTDFISYTIGTDSWTHAGNGVQHADGAYVNVGDYCYAVGGRDATSTPTTTFRRFNSSGSYSTMTAMPEAVFLNGAVYHDGYIYSFGGNFTNAAYDYKGHFRYSISGNSWEELAMPNTGTTNGLQQACGAVFDGLIYWVGDVNYSGTKNNYLYIYDPATDTWVSDGATNVITYPADVTSQGVTSVQDPESGIWYVISRINTYAYTPDMGWVMVGGNGWDLWYFAGAVVSPYDGKIYLVGGRPRNDNSVAGGMPISRLDTPVPCEPAGIITNSPVPATTLQVAWDYTSPDGDPQLQYQFRWTATSGSNYSEKLAVSSSATCGAMSLTGFTTGTYYVSVRTKNLFGWGAWSADVQFSVNTSLSDTALSAPASAPTVGNGVDGVAVTMPALANGAAWYNLYRDGALVVEYLAGAEVYTDTDASKISTQTYTIRGAKTGSESSDSPASTAIAGFPGAPTFSVRPQNTGALVKISQKPYPAVYKIYRGTSGGSRTLVHTSLERPGIGVYTWADSGLTNQSAYDYHVTTEVSEPTTRESAASTIATVTATGRRGRWTTATASIPHAPQLAFVVNGVGYLLCGVKHNGTSWVNSGHVTEYNLSTGAMTAKAELTSLADTRFHMGAVYNDEIYITGLDNTNPEGNTTFAKYTPTTNTWTTTLAQPKSPIGNSLCGVLDGKLYFLLGSGYEDSATQYGSNRVLIYDVAADEWSSGQPLAAKRHYTRCRGTAPVYNGELYLTGGGSEDFASNVYAGDNAVRIYNPDTREWREGPSPISGSGYIDRFTAQDPNDPTRFYVLGGWWGGGNSECLQYDLLTETWTSLPNVPVSIYSNASGAVMVHEGKIHAWGEPPSTTVDYYVFDPVEGDDLALNGSGTLSIEPFIPQDWSGEVELAGDGTLTLTSTLMGVSDDVALTGAGTLTGVGTVPQAEEGDVVLSGEGTIELVAAVELNPPTDITITIVSPTQLDISWTAAPSATGYDIERDGVIIAEYHQSTSYSDTGLTEGTTYTYRVRSQKVVTE